MDYYHMSVLLNESIDMLNIKENGIYVDATLGGAGHAYQICSRLDRGGKLIGIDQDINAINAAEKRLADFKDNLILVHDNFKNIKSILKANNIESIDGAIMDLGVSSHQLDVGERGFSYQKDALLDMRMDTDNILTARDVVNSYSESDLSKILKEYGEEKWAKRIAKFIVQERAIQPIRTTGQLVKVIEKSIPASARRSGPHPAKRTFQAIRIEVNQELEILENAARDFIDLLYQGGRLAVITFHSLEDRIIKQTFSDLSKGCKCPPQFPVCICEARQIVKLITRKPVVPSQGELENNPRARSSKLRVAEKM